MIYLKTFENLNNTHSSKEVISKDSIDSICKEYDIKNYTINSDGSIDVDGNVNLYSKNLNKLPLKFNRVSGYFDCSNNKLTNLVGAPQEVGGDFWCSNNQLTSLEGAPQEVGGIFYCPNNPLPQEIYVNFRYIKNIIELQDLYSIWRRDGSFNKFHFDEMMIDIKGEV